MVVEGVRGELDNSTSFILPETNVHHELPAILAGPPPLPIFHYLQMLSNAKKEIHVIRMSKKYNEIKQVDGEIQTKNEIQVFL